MNRRTSIKSFLGVCIVGVSSFSAYKWFSLTKGVDAKVLFSYKPLIAELAETIIPTTDTPGAKAAGVENFIVNVLINCTDSRVQHKFLNGLNNLENYTLDKYNKTFFKCNDDERIDILKYFETSDIYSIHIFNKINDKIFGQSFFSKLKSLTIEGYASSKLGATKGLAYDYIPVNYEACIPLRKNQKSWATK